jgi:cytochrome c-type biogenesis protein CcmH/NrfG
MTQSTNWLPGLIMLAVGLAAAALYLLTRRKEAPPPEPRDGVLEDLERRYQSLIDQLKELAAEKHTLGQERYEAERSRLELEAASVLRARDEHQKKPGPAAEKRAEPAAPAPGALSPQLTGALWGGGVVIFFGLLSYVLVSELQPRGEDQAPTGRMPPGAMASAQQPQQDPALVEAWERFKANPEDLEAAALLSHELIRGQQFEDAARITHKGLAVDPFNVELRVHKGVLRATGGDVAGAEQELMKLVDTYPDAQEALLFLGAIAMRQGDREKALERFERFAVEVPSEMQPPQLLAAIAQLRQELGKK